MSYRKPVHEEVILLPERLVDADFLLLFFFLTDWKYSTEAQLPSFHHGAVEDAGRVPAVNTFGGEGNSPPPLSPAFHSPVYFEQASVLRRLEYFDILKHCSFNKHIILINKPSAASR